jgi:hypothetical protein
MTNDDATNSTKTPTVPEAPRDGFNDVDDSGTGSLIKGTKIKFTNGAEWIDDTGDIIKPDREFIVIGLKRACQKWLDDLPAETVELGEHESWPDLEQWNEDSPPAEWTTKFGKDQGPWQRCWFAYLLDPKASTGFTWPAGTVGGFRALSELTEATRRARMLQGAGVYPIVTLADRHMNTQYGGRQRPHFVVRGWQVFGAPEASPALDKPADKNEDMNDEIPH